MEDGSKWWDIIGNVQLLNHVLFAILGHSLLTAGNTTSVLHRRSTLSLHEETYFRLSLASTKNKQEPQKLDALAR